MQRSTPAYVGFDSALRVRRWSEQAVRLFGYAADEIAGETLSSLTLVHEDDRERVTRCLKGWITGEMGKPVVRGRIVTSGGEVTACKWTRACSYDEAEGTVSGATLIEPIPDGRAPSDRVINNEMHLRSLVEEHPNGIGVLVDGKIVFANQQVLNILRADRKEQVIGHSVLDFLAPSEHEEAQKRMAAFRQGREPPVWRYWVTRLDGTKCFVELTSRTITYEGKEAIQSVMREVTGPTNREQRLRKQNKVLADLARRQMAKDAELSDVLSSITTTATEQFDVDIAEIWRFEDEGTRFHCLDRYHRPSDVHKTDSVEQTTKFSSLFDRLRHGHPFLSSEAQTDPRLKELHTALEEIDAHAVLSVPIWHGKAVIGALCLLHTGSPHSWLPDEQYFARSLANLTGLACAMHQRRETEKALRASRRQYESIVENVQEVIFQTDRDGRWTFLSEAWTEITGYSIAESLGWHVTEVTFEKDRASTFQKIQNIIREEDGDHHQFRTRFRHKDGQTLWTEVRFRAIRSEDGRLTGSVGTLLDITERRKAEEALRASEQKYRSLTKTAPDAIIMADADTGRILEANEKAAELWGRPVEELVGMKQADLHPTQSGDMYRRPFDEDGVRRNGFIKCSDGKHVPIEISHNVTKISDRHVMQSIFHDVTKQKEHERELVAAKEEAEKMNRLKSTFLANMSHEVRTPLTSIIGFADVLAKELKETEKQELVNMIRESGGRLMDTLNSVLHLSRLESGNLDLQFENIDLAEIARDAVTPFQVQVKRKGLTLEIEEASPNEQAAHACLDRGAIHRVATNLISNAVKFTGKGGTVTVCTGGAAAGQAWLEVEDTGIGISEAFQAHLFDEFEQESSGLSREHEGSGLGLAITQRLTERMGGHVNVESEKGKGSRFRVTFPGYIQS